MKARDVIRMIENRGGVETRVKGSHHRFSVEYVDAEGITRTAHTTVQVHAGREIPIGTITAIQRDLEPAFGKGWLK